MPRAKWQKIQGTRGNGVCFGFELGGHIQWALGVHPVALSEEFVPYAV
jgi:hypothetical protein